NIEDIQRILPHRYPFLLVDRVISEGENTVTGIKNVTCNEPFFQGHFPGRPVMPGVLIIESMAQVAGVLILSKMNREGFIPFFLGIDNARFRKPVVPGDQLVITITILKMKPKVCKVKAEAKVDGEVVSEGELLFSITDMKREG
ncbi:MAG: 3-hydroxyacyl-ACP dehydratase FabZ, partial [Candidatus Omnitrophica bacterium]|nr:3-hydroxyacyl-ACP dehydratase FabZ [Candidatus Omnitrophota bacterium]